MYDSGRCDDELEEHTVRIENGQVLGFWEQIKLGLYVSR